MLKLFSIRYKILLLLIAVSFISGAILLYTSVETFKNDKIAYIFENDANTASQFSEQIAREIQSVNQSVILYLNRFSKTGLLTENTDDKILESSILTGLQIFKQNAENNYSLIDTVKKTEVELISASHPQLSAALTSLNTTKLDFFYLNNLLYFLKKFSINENSYALVYVYKSDALTAFFNTDSSTKSFLIHSDGKIFLKNLNSSADFLKTNFSEYFTNKQSLDNLLTSKIKSDNQENWLLTVSQIPLKGLKLVLLVNEKEALSVLNEMVLKSILIFIILFAFVIIIGIFSANYLTSRLYLLSDHTRKVTEGDFDTLITPTGNDEVTELTHYFNKMTQELARLMTATAHKARMEAELKTAHTVQETLFPKNEYSSDKIEICGHYQSASECGGDWWSYTENKDRIYFWIADATGHGVPAALLTSAAKSAVTLIEDMKLTPIENVTALNKSIHSIAKEKLMMTCFHAVYDKKTRILTYVNASHEPPILFKYELEAFTKSNMVFLNENVCSRLGYSISTEYTSTEYQMDIGDRLYLYTDGIQDISNLAGTSLGERGHIKNLLQVLNAKSDLKSTIKNFTQSLEKFREKTELIDDVTLFFVEVK